MEPKQKENDPGFVEQDFGFTDDFGHSLAEDWNVVTKTFKENAESKGGISTEEIVRL